jgi:hypothetical protein
MHTRNLIYSLFFLFCCESSIAQQTHFIYIQADGNQSFFIKLNDQFYNSSPSGYVILPKLRDGSYKVKVGFPKGDGILQCFDCKIDKKDVGYLLKNFQKGWALFNLQTSGVTMAGSRDSNMPTRQTKENAFVALLSDATADPNQTIATPIAASFKEKPQPQATYNSNCKEEASNDDFLALRKKMASSQKDQEMISEAERMFKRKCFTTDEIRNLSVLFLKDEGKYNFFDAAYPHVSDGNFNSLQDQLTDDYYISRFRVMTRH